MAMDIRTLCLGILTMGDASGYEIKKVFEGPLSHFYEASFGSIYPALTKLTDEGLVSCTQLAQAKRPDKKVYSLTPEGRLVFLDALQEMPGRDRIRSEFLTVMMFAGLLTPQHLSKVIDDRLDHYRQRTGEFAEECTRLSPGAKAFVCGYGRALYQAAIEYIEENRHLVEGEAFLGNAGWDKADAAE